LIFDIDFRMFAAPTPKTKLPMTAAAILWVEFIASFLPGPMLISGHYDRCEEFLVRVCRFDSPGRAQGVRQPSRNEPRPAEHPTLARKLD
jgi:hypothetical protein